MQVSEDSFEEASCNLCGGDRNITRMAINIGGRQVARIVRCRDCGLEYTSPRPTIDFVAQLYQDSYAETIASQPPQTGAGEGAMGGVDRYVAYVDDLGRFSPPAAGQRFLDVGAGFGHLLDLAKGKGWEVWGTEISAEAAEVARRRTGAAIVVVESLGDAGFPDDFFAAITMSAVVEHLRDPLGTLREIRRILKPGGVLGIFTDNSDSLFVALGETREKIEVRYEGLTGRRFPIRGRNKNRYGVITASYDRGVFTLAPARDDPKTVTHFCYWVFQHLFFFTPASLRKMLVRAGFRIVHYPAGSILGPPAKGQRRILQNDLVNRTAHLVGRQSDIVYYATKAHR